MFAKRPINHTLECFTLSDKNTFEHTQNDAQKQQYQTSTPSIADALATLKYFLQVKYVCKNKSFC
jgi:hypothetical protein